MEITDQDKKILSDFCEAWNTLNSSLIIQHLSPAFEYDSQWVMETFDYEHYTDYLTNKFATLKQSAQHPEAQIVADTICPFPLMIELTQGGKHFYYRIKIKAGQVIKGDLCMF